MKSVDVLGLLDRARDALAESTDNPELRDARVAVADLIEACRDLADVAEEAFGPNRPCVLVARAAIARVSGPTDSWLRRQLAAHPELDDGVTAGGTEGFPTCDVCGCAWFTNYKCSRCGAAPRRLPG